MAAQDNATLAQQFYDLYNKRDFDRAVAFVTRTSNGLMSPSVRPFVA
jgi:hypothetical protein